MSKKINWGTFSTIFNVSLKGKILVALLLSGWFFYSFIDKVIKNNIYEFDPHNLSLISFGLILVGGLYNLLAVYSNGDRMPVKTYGEINGKAKKTHFSIRNRKNIRFYFLADILIYKIRKRTHFFSIGDILLLIGLIGNIIYLIISIFGVF